MIISNKKSVFALLLTAFVATLFVSSCKKEEPTPTSGSISIDLDHIANGKTFALGESYRTENGDTVKFTTFNYFLSNFSFIKTDGSVYTVPKDQSYFLIKELANGDNRTLTFKDIPAGDYKSVRFTIGVDSLKSTAPVSERTGALDPAGEAAGMYWAWNSGYIFVKAEGTSPQIPTSADPNREFAYHIGLFGGYTSPTLNNLKTVTLSSADVAKVNGNNPEMHVTVDVMQLFKSPNTINIATTPMVMVSPTSAQIANNYADMFSLEHIHN